MITQLFHLKVEGMKTILKQGEFAQQSMQGTLEEYLAGWELRYREAATALSLFNPVYTQCWALETKQYFAAVLYHARGHFIDFLWYLGNTLPTRELKAVVLSNIEDEFNPNGLSHEALYHLFAKALGVDLSQEDLEEKYYLPEIKSFNRGHLEWLHQHAWQENFSAFCAYEKLDNVDYGFLLALAKSFRLNRQAETFFKIHSEVEHYESGEMHLKDLWQEDSSQVVAGFEFIAEHQLKMWQFLSGVMEQYIAVSGT